MKSPRLRAVVCLALVTFLVAAFASTALAAPHLNWQTLDVYFNENGKPIVMGYFFNDGTETIDRVNWVRLEIWVNHNGGKRFYLGSATWSDFTLLLAPGEQSGVYRLRWDSYNGPAYNRTSWGTKGEINYHIVTGSQL